MTDLYLVCESSSDEARRGRESYMILVLWVLPRETLSVGGHNVVPSDGEISFWQINIQT